MLDDITIQKAIVIIEGTPNTGYQYGEVLKNLLKKLDTFEVLQKTKTIATVHKFVEPLLLQHYEHSNNLNMGKKELS